MTYYIMYDITSKVDYTLLFALYRVSEYNIDTKAYDTIKYESIYQLSKSTGISESTLNRILSAKDNYKDYAKFISHNRDKKEIVIHSSFVKGSKQQFVKLTEQEVNFIIRKSGKRCVLLAKYYIYIKYNIVTRGAQNFTAEQCLRSIGYSTSKTNKDKLCSYNTLIRESGLIKITPTIINGKQRNIYTL